MVSAFLLAGVELWLVGDSTNSDEVKQGRKARHDVKDRGLFSSWKMRICNLLGCISEMEPDGLISAPVAAVPFMTKGSVQNFVISEMCAVEYCGRRI